MSKAAADLQVALVTTGLVQPIDTQVKAGRLEVLCRLIPGQEKAWVAVMDTMLAAAETAGFELHLCRRYVRRDGKMVFGYHIGVQCAPRMLKDAVAILVQELGKAKPSLTPAATAPSAPQQPVSPGRAPGPAGGGSRTYGTRPTGYDASVRVVESKRTDDGQEVVIEEMPLPHVYKEMNAPDPAKGRDGRGARKISSNPR